MINVRCYFLLAERGKAKEEVGRGRGEIFESLLCNKLTVTNNHSQKLFLGVVAVVVDSIFGI